MGNGTKRFSIRPPSETDMGHWEVWDSLHGKELRAYQSKSACEAHIEAITKLDGDMKASCYLWRRAAVVLRLAHEQARAAMHPKMVEAMTGQEAATLGQRMPEMYLMLAWTVDLQLKALMRGAGKTMKEARELKHQMTDMLAASGEYGEQVVNMYTRWIRILKEGPATERHGEVDHKRGLTNTKWRSAEEVLESLGRWRQDAYWGEDPDDRSFPGGREGIFPEIMLAHALEHKLMEIHHLVIHAWPQTWSVIEPPRSLCRAQSEDQERRGVWGLLEPWWLERYTQNPKWWYTTSQDWWGHGKNVEGG